MSASSTAFRRSAGSMASTRAATGPNVNDAMTPRFPADGRRVDRHLRGRAGLGGLAAEPLARARTARRRRRASSSRGRRPRCGTARAGRRGSTGSNAMSSASAGGVETTAWRADTTTVPASTSTRSSVWVIARTGVDSRTASPRSSAMRRAIDPAPPSTRFSCDPFSIENSVLMLPCPRTRSAGAGATPRRGRRSSARGRPSRTGRGRSACGCPTRSSQDATDRSSHSFAFGAVHGASSGSRFAMRSTRQLGQRDRHHGERADLRDEPGVPADAAVADEQVGALDLRLVRRRRRPRRRARARRRGAGRASRRRGRSGVPSASCWVQMRPPTRSRASSTTTALAGLRAAGAPRSARRSPPRRRRRPPPRAPPRADPTGRPVCA